MNDTVEIAIIGGTGVYDSTMFEDLHEVKVYTPFGATSDLITIGKFKGIQVAFLPRHGTHHHIPPHHVPYRANLWALNTLGVKRIIAPTAVGSLREEMAPGDIVIPDQFVDFTKRRDYTFYDGGEVGHISMAHPFCSELRKLTIQAASKVDAKIFEKGTNVCIQGPRFSTKAESFFFRDMVKADTIGMTLVPECLLARELEMCYVSISTVTDYDAWAEEPVNNAMVLKTMEKNKQTLKQIFTELIPLIPQERNSCECPHALENAIM